MKTPEFTGAIIFQPSFAPRPGISHVLFDFDGTLSLIRQGWPEVMVPMFTEVLPALPGETEADRRRLAFEDIMRLNGKQTIYQMIQLCRADPRARRRAARAALVQARIPPPARSPHRRPASTDCASGAIPPDELLVHGARADAGDLHRRGLPLYLASGTDEVFVKQEAELLGLSPYFGPRIYGAQDDYKTFSKKMVIERILRENEIRGEALLSFGDGYVEIENTKEAGGLAVAVASDEAHNGSGRMDAWKRERLSGVGADVVIPDFRDADALLELILGR